MLSEWVAEYPGMRTNEAPIAIKSGFMGITQVRRAPAGGKILTGIFVLIRLETKIAHNGIPNGKRKPPFSRGLRLFFSLLERACWIELSVYPLAAFGSLDSVSTGNRSTFVEYQRSRCALIVDVFT